MLRRHRDSKLPTDTKAEKRHVFSNAKKRLEAFFHLKRPMTADVPDAGCSPGVVEPFCRDQSGDATCEFIVFHRHTQLTVHIASQTVDTSTRHGSTNYPTNHPAAFRFFALPPEIRNEIVRQILVPGSIYLETLSGRWGLRHPHVENGYRHLTATLQRRENHKLLQCTRQIDKQFLTFPPRRFHRIGGSPRTQQPGIQLLATSQSMYAHGHRLFYTQNEFHLAPGPIIISSSYFTRLQPQHRALIRSLVLTFTIADLTPEGFQHVHDIASRYKASTGHAITSVARSPQIALWTSASIGALDIIWRQKLAWLKEWPNLDRLTSVTLDGGGDWKYRIEGKHLVRMLERVEPGDNRDHAWHFRKNCADKARPVLMRLYARGGSVVRTVGLDGGYERDGRREDEGRTVVDVEAAKDWLSASGPGLRCTH